jgi:hypothetical protein
MTAAVASTRWPVDDQVALPDIEDRADFTWTVSPTTHEVNWPSIGSAMAICRQALPVQLEYPRD